MKRWQIVYGLPLEVWVEIFSFPWISREEFGRIVDQIGNFKFAEHAQFFLHEWGKRRLSGVHFYQQDGLCKYVDNEPFYLEIPQTPLPPNIRSFEHIQIDYFDANTMDFLRRIGSLLTDVEIDVAGSSSCVDSFRTIWTHLSPLLDGSWSLRTDYCPLGVVKCFRERFAERKMLKIAPFAFSPGFSAIFQIIFLENVNFIVDWLTLTLNDSSGDGPILCKLRLPVNKGFFEQILLTIREQFLASTTPCTFALNVVVRIRIWRGPVAEFQLENNIGEQLHGVWNGDERVFQITRHPANCNKEGLQEWIKQNMKEASHGRIQIYYPTVGSIDAAHMDEEQQDDQQQPCSSKDA